MVRNKKLKMLLILLAAIAYVDLNSNIQSQSVVNALSGSAIVGTTFNFDYDYDGQKYTLNVSDAYQSIAIRGTTTNPSKSFVVLFPNDEGNGNLIADNRFLYNFKDPITANSLYYRYISDAEIGTLPWDDYGYEFVDLGLPSGLKWATCNIGASNPSDHGHFYEWGATGVDGSYYDGSDDISGTIYDVATSSWGEKWRMPTQVEMQELLENCTLTFEFGDGDSYLMAVSNHTGNIIYLPCAGYNMLGEPTSVNSQGFYWTSTPGENVTYAYGMKFSMEETAILTNKHIRNYGYSVRAVAE